MSRHGVFASSLGGVHESNMTPHIAVALIAVLSFLPAGILTWAGVGLFDSYGLIGTTATLGFILSYVLVSIAAPAYLYRRGEFRPFHLLVPIVAIAFMGIAFVGAIYPLPEGPAVYPVYAFLILLTVGVVWGLVLHIAVPAVRRTIHADLTSISSRFRDGAGI